MSVAIILQIVLLCVCLAVLSGAGLYCFHRDDTFGGLAFTFIALLMLLASVDDLVKQPETQEQPKAEVCPACGRPLK